MPEQKEIFDTYVVECSTCGSRLQDAVQCIQCGSRPLMRSMTKATCMKHGKFHIRLSKLLHGAGCPKCAQSSLSAKRISPRKKIYVRCENGHEYFTVAASLIAPECPYCEGKLHTKNDFVLNGKTYSSLAEVSLDYNIPERAILTRLRNGMNLDQAVEARTQRTSVKWQGNFEKWKKVQEKFQEIEPQINSPVDYIQRVKEEKSSVKWNDKEKAILVEYALKGVLIDTISVSLDKSPEDILRMMDALDVLEKHTLAHPEYLQSMADEAADRAGLKSNQASGMNLGASVEQVQRLIDGHENSFVEFKETFSKDIATGNKSPAIINSAVKTVAGFANTTGGILIIGVSDDQIITGIEKDEPYKSDDEYVRRLGETINSWLSDYAGTLITISTVKMSKNTVCLVKVSQSKHPIYCSNKKYDGGKTHFYVRQNNLTKSLDAEAAIMHFSAHFDKS